MVGGSQCSISDTYWQTETGGHILTPLPGATPAKPGAACFPFFGVVPHIMNEAGEVLEGECEGYIVFSQPLLSLGGPTKPSAIPQICP